MIAGSENVAVQQRSMANLDLMNEPATLDVSEEQQQELNELMELAAAQQRAIAEIQAELAAAVKDRAAVETRLRESEELFRMRSSVLANYQAELEEANHKLRDLAVTDELTGLRNRRAFEERLAYEFSVARRKGRDLSVVLLDADDFKKVNDRLGHAAGDTVLQQLGKLLQKTVRLSDLAVRFGGEEFAVILPESDETSALYWCRRLQRELREVRWEKASVTLSMGVAGLTPECADGGQLVAMADQALYCAKRRGKDCYVGAGESRGMGLGIRG